MLFDLAYILYSVFKVLRFLAFKKNLSVLNLLRFTPESFSLWR